MHFVESKTILSAKNGMNLFRGCLHGCIYCDSRSDCYQMKHPFEDVEVKSNSLQLLESALKSKRKKCMIGMGSMTDPYMPNPVTLRYTRGAVELAERYNFGLTLITKSDRVLSDIDLFERIQRKSKCVIQMTLTTYDDRLCKKIEPAVCTTKERFHALQAFRERQIPTVVWLSPVLPFINDTRENLEGILNYCAEARVKGVICFGMGLTLREGNREFFYEKLDEKFSSIKEKYISTYGNNYMISSRRNGELMRFFHSFCEEHGMMHDINQIFEYLSFYEEKSEQLSLF